MVGMFHGSTSYLVAQCQETPHTFIVKFRRKGPLSIDKTDIHNAHTSGPLPNMRVVWLWNIATVFSSHVEWWWRQPNSGSHKRCGRPFVGYLPHRAFVKCEFGETCFQLPCRFTEDWNRSQGPEHEIRRYDRIVQVTWMSNLDSQHFFDQTNSCLHWVSSRFWFNSCLNLELDATLLTHRTQSDSYIDSLFSTLIHGTPFAASIFLGWGSRVNPVYWGQW